MEEGRLAYRVRTAEADDALALRDGIGTTLAHPDHQGRRESYRGAAARGDILILERYDRPAHDWQLAGFVECHMRVDDNLSIRDIGTTGDEPQTGVVRYLLDQAFNSFRPTGSQVKIRRDARNWVEIFEAIPGFYREGEEYRRPHYWSIWRWDRQHAAEAERQSPRPATQQSQRLRPRPPEPPTPTPGSRTPRRDPPGPPQRGPRPGDPGPPARNGPRPAGPNGPVRQGPSPAGPSGPVRNAFPRPGGPPRRPKPTRRSP
ncbi:MAG: hypothetical protein M3069_04935 [Chloroflexota bacterium]|nr:hypothetical protein [Chloroflexota bacterium]